MTQGTLIEIIGESPEPEVEKKPRVGGVLTSRAHTRTQMAAFLREMADTLENTSQRIIEAEDGESYAKLEVKIDEGAWRDTSADEIYSAYPRKAGRARAIRAIQSAVNHNGVDPVHLLERVKAYSRMVVAKVEDKRFVPHPASWINGWRWEDDALLEFIEAEERKGAEDMTTVEAKAKFPQGSGETGLAEGEEVSF